MRYFYVGGVATAIAIGTAIALGGGGGEPITGPCFASPGACGLPDPAFNNVGVPSGTSLTPSGSITVSTPGTTLNALDVTGKITVNATNVTISNTRVTATGPGCGASTCGNSVVELNCVCDLTLSHVELTAPPTTTVEHAIRNDGGGTIHLDYVYQHGATDALCWCGHAIVSNSYSFITLSIANDHLENLYVDDNTLSVTHSVLINDQPQTSNMFGNVGNGFGGACVNHITMDGNLFAGAGQTLTMCAHGDSQGSSTVSITNNRFARCNHGQGEVPGGDGTWFCPGGPDSMGYFPRGGSFTWVVAAYPNTVWTGNVWDDDDTAVPSP